MAGSDDLLDRAEYSRIFFVEQLRADLRVAIDTEHQLRQVIRTNRYTVDTKRRVSGNVVDDRRNLGHDPPFQTALTAQRTLVDELETRLELPLRTNERDH